jgi:hypothetical protein
MASGAAGARRAVTACAARIAAGALPAGKKLKSENSKFLQTLVPKSNLVRVLFRVTVERLPDFI